MGKKNKTGATLGRALIKDRFGTTKGKKTVAGDPSMVSLMLLCVFCRLCFPASLKLTFRTLTIPDTYDNDDTTLPISPSNRL